MTINQLADVEFGQALPAFEPDTSLDTVRKFAELVGWDGARFNDHEAARQEGLPGAIVPGILSQGYLVAMIHQWAQDADIAQIDTVFRAPVLADQAHTISGVVTDIDDDQSLIEIDLTVTNEKNETRVFGTASVRLPA